MTKEKRATALPGSTDSSRLSPETTLILSEEKSEKCLLSSGSQVRILPGTPGQAHIFP
ncbi:MAG: hypothetical protein V3R96_03660 [Dehalococcoidales bacterium]